MPRSGPEVRRLPSLYWAALEASFRPRLGDARWLKTTEAGPSIEAFSKCLIEIDDALGGPRAGVQEEAASRIVESWGEQYRRLVDQFRDRPDRLLELFLAEVQPAHDRSPENRVTNTGARLALDPHLPERFQRQLVTSLLELAGARPEVRQAGEHIVVSWRSSTATRLTPGRLARLLLSTVRFPFLTATLVPVFVALAIAAQDGAFRPALAALTVVGVAFFQFGTNAINDYYDRVSGTQARSIPVSPFRTTGGPAGDAFPPSQLNALAYSFYGAGTCVGLILVWLVGIEVLWLGLAGFLLGFLYSAPPVRLAYRGLGELAVAVGFGPLIVTGAYFVQTGAWSLEALLASLPLAFLIAAVLYINEFPDRDGDAKVGKRTLIVRLPERSAVIGYVALIGLTYLVILGGVALREIPQLARFAFPPWSLLGLLTLPLAVKASVILSRNYRYPYRLIPANTATVQLHILTGLLFSAGYLVSLVP